MEAKAARGAQLLEKQKNEEAKQPSCNSRWSQDEGGEVCLPDVESIMGTKQSLCFSQSSYNVFSLCFQYCAVMEAYNVHLV